MYEKWKSRTWLAHLVTVAVVVIVASVALFVGKASFAEWASFHQWLLPSMSVITTGSSVASKYLWAKNNSIKTDV
jgi:hypothetical protein